MAGTAEFVLNSAEGTEVGFLMGGTWGTLVYADLPGTPSVDITDSVAFGRFAINDDLGSAVASADDLAFGLHTTPETGTASLLTLGLTGLALRGRRLSTRQRNKASGPKDRREAGAVRESIYPREVLQD